MKAIILAAGRGSRMKHLTNEQPKCLVKVRGKTLLCWQLDALRSAGITEISIVTGYKREMLVTQNIREFHNTRWATTNMVTSLMCASEWLESGPCIVTYSDIFYDVSAINSLIHSTASLAITYDPDWLSLWSKRFGDPLLDAESLQMTSDYVVTDIGNKPASVSQIQGQYMGLLRFTPLGWAEFVRILAGLTDELRDKIHMTGAIQRLISFGRVNVMAVPFIGEWGEVDSETDLDCYK